MKILTAVVLFTLIALSGCVSMKIENSGNGKKQVYSFKMIGLSLFYPTPNLNIEEKR